MENFLNPCDKEYIRMAILKHEETFKQQVHELHRLYRIQKLLMTKIGIERPKTQQNQEVWNSRNNTSFAQKKLDWERPADEEYAAESRVASLIDESEIELTLGPSNYSRRRNNSTKTDTPLTSDSGPSFSSSSTGSSHSRIHTSNFRLNTKTDQESDGLFQVPDMSLAYQNENKNFDDRLRQERLKQPPWLLQVLSLNMT